MAVVTKTFNPEPAHEQAHGVVLVSLAVPDAYFLSIVRAWKVMETLNNQFFFVSARKLKVV